MATTVTKIDVYTMKDEAGNPRTIGWFEVGFTGNYVTGGMSVDLSPYFRHISDIYARPASVANSNLDLVPDETTFGTPASVSIRMASAGAEAATTVALDATRVRLQVLGF